MATAEFAELINTELVHIDTRCEEIDETSKALVSERGALEKRKKMLETTGTLYEQSQEIIEEALETQLRLHPATSYEDDGEEGYEDDAEQLDHGEEDESESNEPSIRSVS